MKDGQPYRFRPADFVPVSDPGGQWTYFTLSGLRPRADAGEPVQPLYQESLGVLTLEGRKAFAARGVVLTGATYADRAAFRPLVQPAGTMSEPRATGLGPSAFEVPGWYPRAPLGLRVLYHNDRRRTIDPTRTQAELRIHAGQYNAATSTERLFEELLVDEYNSAAADRTGPRVAEILASPSGGGEDLALTAADESGILRVAIAFVAPGQPWRSVELVAAGAGDRWEGRLPVVPEAYLAQVVDKAGNVTTVDDRGEVQRPRVGDPSPAAGPWSTYLPWLGNQLWRAAADDNQDRADQHQPDSQTVQRPSMFAPSGPAPATGAPPAQ